MRKKVLDPSEAHSRWEPPGDWLRITTIDAYAEGEVDRSPTGTGVSGRAAIHHARGEIGVNQPMVIESIIGTPFTGRVARTTTFGPYPAVVPEVEGRAFITGRNEFLIDPQDPLPGGFILR